VFAGAAIPPARADADQQTGQREQQQGSEILARQRWLLITDLEDAPSL
jgi:hypothetical protein